MPYFNIQYVGSKMSLLVDEEELQVKRLKNLILSYFSQINFSDVSLFIYGLNDKICELDDNETIDSESQLFLEISKDIEPINIFKKIRNLQNV